MLLNAFPILVEVLKEDKIGALNSKSTTLQLLLFLVVTKDKDVDLQSVLIQMNMTLELKSMPE